MIADPVAKPAAESASTAGVDKEKGARLPAPFGMLGLSASQREKLLSVQGEFDPRIEQLKKEIHQLTEERNRKMEEHLTPGQRTRLTEIQTEAATAKKQKEKKSS